MSQLSYVCGDFLSFQEALKKMREVDDKIIYALNTSLPTDSFKGQVNGEQTCKELYDKLTTAHENREKAIRDCILVSAESLKSLRDQQNLNDITTMRKFKTEQRKLRVLQSEMLVEEILKQKSYKIFHERCRQYSTTGEWQH